MTVTNIVTRPDALEEILLLFPHRRFKDILKCCTAKSEFVRLQALVLVSEIGVSDDANGGLKQKVLQEGTVEVIVEVR